VRAALRAEWTKLRTVPDAAVALPLIALLLFFQRQIIKGIATTGFGGQ